jgi:small-conductance mechanosensitive channel
MIESLLKQRTMLRDILSATETMINEAYRSTLSVKVGDTVILNGSRGVVTEITYFAPIKVCLYRKDGELSRQHRLCRDVGMLAK